MTQVRRAIKYKYCAHSTPTVASLCDQKADQRLFVTVTQNNALPLQQLLPPKIEKHYSTRAHPHNYQLPERLLFLLIATLCIVCCIVTF